MLNLNVRRLRRQADLGRDNVRRALHNLRESLHGDSGNGIRFPCAESVTRGGPCPPWQWRVMRVHYNKVGSGRRV